MYSFLILDMKQQIGDETLLFSREVILFFQALLLVWIERFNAEVFG